MKRTGGSTRGQSVGEAPEGAADLLATIASFWPGAEVRYGGEPRTAEAVFHFMPHARSPRLLLPGVSKVAAAQSMLRFSAALSPKEVLGRSAVAAALRIAGPTIVAGDIITVHHGRDSLQRHISEILGEPITMAVTIGNARVNRKPVLQIFDVRGRTVAFAKVGDSPVAVSDVSGEATKLTELEGRLKGFEIPRVLSLTHWRGMVVMLLTAVRTVPQDPRRFWRIPRAAMDDFSRQLGHAKAPLAQVPSWQRIRAAQDALADTKLPELMDRLEQMVAEVPELVVGSWHGDWTGWNMAMRRGVVQLWDFERFESGVVQGIDVFHYATNATTLREGANRAAIQRGLDLGLSAIGDGVRERVVAAAYLVTVTARYLQAAAASEQGHLITGRAATMIEALAEWLPQIRGAGPGLRSGS